MSIAPSRSVEARRPRGRHGRLFGLALPAMKKGATRAPLLRLAYQGRVAADRRADRGQLTSCANSPLL
jgi:hypothetical protein